MRNPIRLLILLSMILLAEIANARVETLVLTGAGASGDSAVLSGDFLNGEKNVNLDFNTSNLHLSNDGADNVDVVIATLNQPSYCVIVTPDMQPLSSEVDLIAIIHAGNCKSTEFTEMIQSPLPSIGDLK